MRMIKNCVISVCCEDIIGVNDNFSPYSNGCKYSNLSLIRLEGLAYAINH